MKVFIAGGTGVIGRPTVRRLVDAGHTVTGLARSDDAERALSDMGAKPVRADIFDRAALIRAIDGHDAVINLATAIPPGLQAAKAEAWALNNRIRREGSRNLVDAAIAARARVYVQESVAFLYPDHGAEWTDEDSPLAASLWTEAVEAAEANTARFSAGGGRGVALRFGGFYSADSEHTRLLVKGARRGFALDLGRHDAFFPVIYVEDAAAAVVAALDAPAGVYNVVDDEPMTRRDQAAVWSAVMGRPVRRLPAWLARFAGPAAAPAQRSMRVSNRRLRGATGWRPEASNIADSLPAVVDALGGPPPRLDILSRVGLWIMLLVGLSTAAWIGADPHGFYAGFPLGRGWVAADGPYNEHLVRDYGAMNLALAAVTASALLRRTGELAGVAALAWIAFGLPHLAYHLGHLDLYEGWDVAGNVLGTAGIVVVPAAILAARRHAARRTSAPRDGARGSQRRVHPH